MSAGRGHHLKRLEQNIVLLSSENVADVLHFLTLQNMHNMPNLSINIKKKMYRCGSLQNKILFYYAVSKALTSEFTFPQDYGNGV
jgi:hypothetical protein